METTPANSSACEICGALPESHYVRNQDARDARMRYVRTRRNRVRLDIAYWITSARVGPALATAGIDASWDGRLACEICAAKVARACNV